MFRKLATEVQENSGVLGCQKFRNWAVWETAESGSAQTGVGLGAGPGEVRLTLLRVG